MSAAVRLRGFDLSRNEFLAFFAVLFFITNGVYATYRGTPENMLWFCNLGCLLIGLGLLLRSNYVFYTGFLWQLVGFPVWFNHVVHYPDKFFVTTYLVHLGGPLIGFLSFNKFKMPNAIGLKVTILSGILHYSCKFVPGLSREISNVNLSHHMLQEKIPYITSLGDTRVFMMVFSVFLYASLVYEYALRFLSVSNQKLKLFDYKIISAVVLSIIILVFLPSFQLFNSFRSNLSLRSVYFSEFLFYAFVACLSMQILNSNFGKNPTSAFYHWIEYPVLSAVLHLGVIGVLVFNTVNILIVYLVFVFSVFDWVNKSKMDHSDSDVIRNKLFFWPMSLPLVICLVLRGILIFEG